MSLNRLAIVRKLGVAMLCAITASIAIPTLQVKAQEAEQKQKNAEQQEQTQEEGAEEAESDPYEIPAEASVEDLFTFIEGMKKVRPPRGDFQEMVATAQKVFPAILEAADLVLQKTEDEEEMSRAISEKFYALSTLQRFDPSVTETLSALANQYKDSDVRDIAVTANGHLIKSTANERELSSEQAEELAAQVVGFLDKFGVDRSTYSTAATVARTLGYSEHTEVAAKLYEKMAPLFRESEEESLAARAESMLGSARRLRLPGNSMEVFGTKANGESFDWDDYKGKVVLVDFWASWCGPCMGEIPNMKKNLELYGERGFEIVGINMDSTREAFETCVENRDINWVNIVSEEEGKTGWQAPMATHYGITGIPTAILVDQEGKVVSLRARGKELDQLLEELLGPAETEAEAGIEVEDAAPSEDDE